MVDQKNVMHAVASWHANRAMDAYKDMQHIKNHDNLVAAEASFCRHLSICDKIREMY